MIFRVHLFYYAEKEEKKNELSNHFKKLSTFKNIFVNYF